MRCGICLVFKIIDINQMVPEADGLNIYSGFSDLQVEKKNVLSVIIRTLKLKNKEFTPNKV